MKGIVLAGGAGTVKLVGTNYSLIVKEVSMLLDDGLITIRWHRLITPTAMGWHAKELLSL